MPGPPPFTLDQVMGYPFPENLRAAPAGGRIAWTFNERGARNIYVADAPDFAPRKLTSYDADEGQELTNLSFSPGAIIVSPSSTVTFTNNDGGTTHNVTFDAGVVVV